MHVSYSGIGPTHAPPPTFQVSEKSIDCKMTLVIKLDNIKINIDKN